eukprot:13252419-Alexandrium_andersonii.AAC.1
MPAARSGSRASDGTERAPLQLRGADLSPSKGCCHCCERCPPQVQNIHLTFTSERRYLTQQD